ncbi:MAG: zinc ribbon domain-containing protein [Pseudomonadota bacterium]
MSDYYLAPGLPIPVAETDGLSAPFWEGLRDERIMIQQCRICGRWQWGPEWLCHHCLSFEMAWNEVNGAGRIYSWERSWHPVHPALKDATPYISVLVELPHAGNVRLLGNLLGDRHQEVVIGSDVQAVFEHHPDAEPPFTLLQWRAGA